MEHNLDANKHNAIAFYRMAYLGEPSKAVVKYVGVDYIQHNPIVGDGKQPFIDFVFFNNCFLLMTGKRPLDLNCDCELF